MYLNTECTDSILHKMEQKEVNYKVLKEKIIRTDELLKKYQEKQNACKQYKTEIKELKLKCSLLLEKSNQSIPESEILKLKIEKLEQENGSLIQQKAQLQSQHTKLLLESTEQIDNLQKKIATMNKLESSSNDTKLNSLKDEIKICKNRNEKMMYEIADLKKYKECYENQKVSYEQLKVEQTQKIKVIQELREQLQIQENNLKNEKSKVEDLLKEISLLKTKTNNFEQLQKQSTELVDKLAEVEFEFDQWKAMCTENHADNKSVQEKSHVQEMRETIQIYQQSVLDLNNKIKLQQDERKVTEKKYDILQNEMLELRNELTKLNQEKNLNNDKQNEYVVENKQLLEKIDADEKTIKYLKTQLNFYKTEPLSQTESTDSAIDLEFDSDILSEIFNEMIPLPRLVSPFELEDTFQDLPDAMDTQVPSILITPSTPIEKMDIPSLDEEISKKLTEQKRTIVNLNKRLKKKFTYNDFIKQQNWLRQRKIAMKRRLRCQKKNNVLYSDGILESLKALKKSNISFVITNETPKIHTTYLPSIYDNHMSNLNYDIFNKLLNYTPNIPGTVEKLNCSLKSCNQNYMMLKTNSDEVELLGFFSIKPEEVTQMIPHTKHPHENKPPDPNDAKNKDPTEIITSKRIANEVIEALKSDGLIIEKPKTRKRIRTERIDSLCSETESEIERLFKRPTVDVLEQNKKLLKEARRQHKHLSSIHSSPNKSSRESSFISCNDTFKGNKSIEQKNETFNAFKVPACPSLLSPISSSIDVGKSPRNYLSPLKKPLEISSIKHSNSATKLNFSTSEILVDSDASFCIKRFLENDQSLTNNLDGFVNTFSLNASPNRLDSGPKSIKGHNINEHFVDCPMSPDSVRTCSTYKPKLIPLERSGSISSCTKEYSTLPRREVTAETAKIIEILSAGRVENELVEINEDLHIEEIVSCETPIVDNSKNDKFVFSHDRNNKLNSLSNNKTVNTVKRKPKSKIKSNVIQQMKRTRSMFNNGKPFGCDRIESKNGDDIKITSQQEDCLEDRVTKTKSEATNENHGSSSKEHGKIHVVQNIIIKPGAEYVNNSHKQSITNNSNSSCDVLTEIMDGMDKDRPCSRASVGSKTDNEYQPITMDDKKFRSNLLDIAEGLYGEGNKNLSQHQNLSFERKSNLEILRSKILKKGYTLPITLRVLCAQLYQCCHEEAIPRKLFSSFRKLPKNIISDVILHEIRRNSKELPTHQYVNAPLLTEKQKLFLCLLLTLEKEQYGDMTDYFLNRIEQHFFIRNCDLKEATHTTRLYLTICRLKTNITRVRTFLRSVFYFMDDRAIPICYTILTNWMEVMPMWENRESYPLCKVFFQILHLTICKKIGYNLFNLKCLFAQYYHFPKERLNCDELFTEIYEWYLKDPADKDREFAIRLLCKYKEKSWVYTKINQYFKPLVYKIPEHNVNFKATVIILLGKLCQNFKQSVAAENNYLMEMSRWFLGIIEDGAPQVISDSVTHVIQKISKKKPDRKGKHVRQLAAKKNQ